MLPVDSNAITPKCVTTTHNAPAPAGALDVALSEFGHPNSDATAQSEKQNLVAF